MQPLSISPPHSPPPIKQNMLSPLYQFVLPKQIRNLQNLTPDSLLYSSKFRSREQPILRQPRKTKPIVWFAAILCMIFSILIILFGIATLIIFLAVQPKNPVFDTPAASLSAIYFNPPEFINGDVTFLANFSNPNRRLSVRYEYLHVQLYFSGSLMAAQVLRPFSQSPGEASLVSVRLLSSSVYLPPNLAMELQRQVQSNRVVYNMKGAFRVRVRLGLIHYSYWLHGECHLEMTSPPNNQLKEHEGDLMW
ncbi:hypothetical protein DH2020_016976 [Rehmannia glutinosa]|uniref:Late embryogenesis abundant protein LEA-2 subgroup domain-containing protein n=1 Tax=Rehmannia glutinosa TaxID=99300 RepID=A0ABR0WQ68_REHGL